MSSGTPFAIDGRVTHHESAGMAKRNRQHLIAEFRDGPYDGQRREMEYRQVFWRPANEAGVYVRSGELVGDHIRNLQYTPDKKAIFWVWTPDIPREEL